MLIYKKQVLTNDVNPGYVVSAFFSHCLNVEHPITDLAKDTAVEKEGF